jgi:hypothetical protein
MEDSDDALCLACGLSWPTAAAAQPRPRGQQTLPTA